MIDFMRVAVPMNDATSDDLGSLADAAGVSRAEWVRGAIRAAKSSVEVRQAVVDHVDGTRWGGYRPGAGRPRKEKQADGDDTEGVS